MAALILNGIVCSRMQVSSKSLSSDQAQSIHAQLNALLASLTKSDDVKLLLRDLLSDTERTVIAKRLAIAAMLHQEKSYKEIRQTLKVSSATISSVSEICQTDGIKLAVKHIEAEAWADSMVNRWFK